MAQKLLYNELLQQARLWAYVDSFRIYAIWGLAIIVLIFLMKSNKNVGATSYNNSKNKKEV